MRQRSGLLVAVALLLAACAPAAPSAQPTTTPASPVVEASVPASQAVASNAPAAPVVVSGTGRQKTAPFVLGAGYYRITIAGESARDNDFVTLKLYPVTPDPSDSRDTAGWLLFNEERITKGGYTLETNEYNLEAREYYLDARVPEGSWTVTFEPAVDESGSS